MSQVQWTGDEWLRRAVPAFNAGVTAAAAVMADQAARNFGTEGGGLKGSGRKIDVATGKRKGSLRPSGTWIPAPPGAFPGVRTSNLRNSIAFVRPEDMGTPLVAAFGTAVKYGRWLEMGTSKMPARPWIVRSALESQPRAMAQAVRATARQLKQLGLVEIV